MSAAAKVITRLFEDEPAGLSIVADGDWLRLETACTDEQGFRAGVVGAPGMWKRLARGDGERLVLEIPRGVLAEGAEDPGAGAGASAPFFGLVAWAERTLVSGGVAGCEAPADIGSALEEGSLTIVAGGVARQAAIVSERGRLALRCLLGEIPAGLSEGRRKWLEALIGDASRRLRMVRVGCDARQVQVMAEVDLTGVPSELAGPLVRYSARALQLAGAWLLEPVETVLEGEFTSLNAFWRP